MLYHSSLRMTGNDDWPIRLPGPLLKIKKKDTYRTLSLRKFPSSSGRLPSRLLSSRFLFTKGNIGISRWFIVHLEDKIKEAVSVFFIQSMEGRQVSQFDRNMAWQRVTIKIPAHWTTQCGSAMKKQSCLNDNSSKHCWNHIHVT